MRWAIRIFALLALACVAIAIWSGLQFFIADRSDIALQQGELAITLLLALPGLILVLWSLGQIARSLRELGSQRTNARSKNSDGL